MALVCISAAPALAQDPPPPNPFGMGWGIGMGFSDQLIGQPLVEEGDVFIDANGIVRITRFRNIQPRTVLESHYTFRFMGGSFGIGPVMFIQPGSTLFDAAGGGLLIELGEGPTSFNVIVGGLIDFEVTRLHRDYIDGFEAPTPNLVFVRKEELQLFIGFVVGR